MKNTAPVVKADKSVVDAMKTTQDGVAARVLALESVPVATLADVRARSTTVCKLTPSIVRDAIAAIMADAHAIVEWDASTVYAAHQIVLRNKAFFESNISNNANKDPVTDASGAWAPFTPGETSSIFLNRGPTNTDVYPIGVKWYDLSFGSDTPLVQVSMGNGVWVFLNVIKLTKIRVYAHGQLNTYRSSINGTAFYRPDGTQIPNNWFVWGASSGISGGATGVAFSGQQIYAGYNGNGWTDIETSSAFDTSVSIGSIKGNFASGNSYISCDRVEFWYSNGSKKVYSGQGFQQGLANLTTCDPPVVCRYGDATAAAQGEMLTGAKLSDGADNTYGRISGAALSSAHAVLFANAIAAYEQRIAALEARLPPV